MTFVLLLFATGLLIWIWLLNSSLGCSRGGKCRAGALEAGPHCEVCSGHGVPNRERGGCECNEGYTGFFCENCGLGFTRPKPGERCVREVPLNKEG